MGRDCREAPWRGPGTRTARLVLLLVGLGGLLVPRAMAADERLLAYGRHLAAECSACHRSSGADKAIPAIAGRAESEILSALRAYKDGSRRNAVMASVAQSLDEDQMAALAAYYASQPPPAGTGGAR